MSKALYCAAYLVWIPKPILRRKAIEIAEPKIDYAINNQDQEMADHILNELVWRFIRGLTEWSGSNRHLVLRARMLCVLHNQIRGQHDHNA